MSEMSEMIQLTGRIVVHGVDTELWPLPDEKTTAIRLVNLYLGKSQPSPEMKVKDVRWGGECRVEVSGTASIVEDGIGVRLEAKARFYEGTSEDTDDLEDSGSITILVATGNTSPSSGIIRLGKPDGDRATVEFEKLRARRVVIQPA